ncbi:MAG: riboflavin synthase [Deltaproteobacteria bacterium]|nr:riboflavin synthase [Deltaproteobacteria bacterium]
MFTGLVEAVGQVEDLTLGKQSAVLTVQTGFSDPSLPLGASIAVNGACLTVVKKTKRSFTVDVSPETLQRTSLQNLRTGTLVNLERSMRLKDRLGGHIVTGHIDGVGIVHSIDKQGDFTFFSVQLKPQLASLLVAKGSVAVDGISLTVNACNRRDFSVAVIPFTLQHTNLRARRVGDKVNLETDLIGKYVYKFMKQPD